MHVYHDEVLSAAVEEPELSRGAKPSSTKGVVNYVKKAAGHDQLYVNVYTDDKDPSNLELQETEVTVHDIRAEENKPSLETNGFGLFKLEVPDDIDWDNKEDVSILISAWFLLDNMHLID